MEFTNEIFFNKPLVAGSTVIITYCGKLYREHSKDVAIVYGYGDNWECTDSTPMIETENGFEVTLTIKDYNVFNFCFSNSFDIWDNNSGCNYIAPISPRGESNEDFNTTEEASSSSSSENVEENEEQAEDNNQETQDEAKEDDIEAAFASLLDSILDSAKADKEEIDVSELSGFGLQSVENINEDEVINCDEIFEQLFNELTEEDVSQDEAKVEETADEEIDYSQCETKELDELMDNLLLSLQEDNSEADKEVENSNLPAVVENPDWLDRFINFSYNLTKRFTTACKKFGNLVKLKAKEIGFINDKND